MNLSRHAQGCSLSFQVQYAAAILPFSQISIVGGLDVSYEAKTQSTGAQRPCR